MERGLARVPVLGAGMPAFLSLWAALAASATPLPTGCPDFEVEQPRQRGGVVRAADFGFSPTNSDNAAAINLAVAECRRSGAGRLELAPGTYRCHGPEGIVLSECEDLVLDGMGAVLVFWRKHPKDWEAADGGPVGDWQRSPPWMVKFEATSFDGPDRIYRLLQCEKKAGIANVITEKFLRHGPGRYHLAFDAAATLGDDSSGATVPMTADFVSNEKTISLAFGIPPDGAWHHVELDADLDFDPVATGLVAALLRAGIPVDEVKFRRMSLTKDGNGN